MANSKSYKYTSQTVVAKTSLYRALTSSAVTTPRYVHVHVCLLLYEFADLKKV
jgi:hypothetical protein